MSNSSRILANNNEIQSVIDMINALPEAVEKENLDDVAATQDTLIANIITALNGKAIDSGEAKLQNKTVTPSTSKQTITADSGYDGLGTVTVNAMKTATQATPSITVSSSGLITASATQSAGYVSAGTKSATKQLTTDTWTLTYEDGSTETVTVVTV